MDHADLAALVNAIIPADEIDRGAAEVDAAAVLAAREVNAALYRDGLAEARRLAGGELAALSADEAGALLQRVRETKPAFYTQLRLDVCALYLSNPGVWKRIGFPGPQSGNESLK